MEDFDSLMKQAVSLKTSQMMQKRRKFENMPLFVKAGLYYLPKFANVRKQGFYQRYAVCDHLKGRGNKLFKSEHVEEAAREYEQALSIFRYISNKNPNWKNEGILDEDLEYVNFDGEQEEEREMAISMKIALYNNLAACYLNLKDYPNAKAACDEALLLDPLQTKALYRRAKALTSDINAEVEDYKAAQNDLKKALELSPDDSVIQQALNKIKSDLVRAKTSSQSFKGIFTDKKKNLSDKDSGTDNSASTAQSQKKEGISTNKTDPGHKEERKVEKDAEKKSLSSIDTTSTDVKPSVKPKVSENARDIKHKEEEKIADKKAASNSGGAKGEKIDKDNEVWRMLHGNKDPKDANYDYPLSFENKENVEIPREIKELEKFLEKRGNDLLRMYETSGRTEQANELKENLRKAMAAKQRLEKISKLDFEKPNDQLKEVAEKFGLDLKDPAIKDELRNIQQQNLEDIRNWIGGIDPEYKKATESLYKKEKKLKDRERMANQGGHSDVTNLTSANVTTNNYFINNNYYSTPEALEHILADPVSKAKLMESLKEQQGQQSKSAENNKLLNDLVENVNRLTETDSNSKVTRIMNLVIIAVAVGLFMMTLYLQTSKNKTMPGRLDFSRDM